MSDVLKITNHKGRQFNVVVTKPKKEFKRTKGLMNEYKEPVVEFFDATYENKKSFGSLGQFVSSYFVSTLLEHSKDHGLDLMGHEPAWKIDAKAMREVIAWLKKQKS